MLGTVSRTRSICTLIKDTDLPSYHQVDMAARDCDEDAPTNERANFRVGAAMNVGHAHAHMCVEGEVSFAVS